MRGRSTPEVKAVDTAMTINADTTGGVQLVDGLAPGSAVNQRIGRKVRLISAHMNWVLQVTPGTGVDQVQRCLVVMDHQTNGAALAITDVLTAVGTESLPNYSNTNRFTILLDRRFNLNATAEPGSRVVFDSNIPLHANVYFNTGTAGTVADIVKNSLYVIGLGSTAPGATAGTVNCACRVLFSDE